MRLDSKRQEDENKNHLIDLHDVNRNANIIDRNATNLDEENENDDDSDIEEDEDIDVETDNNESNVDKKLIVQFSEFHYCFVRKSGVWTRTLNN